MKQIFFVISLSTAVFLAHADIQSATGIGFTRVDACASAKSLAESIVKAKFRKAIQRYEDCSCSSSSGGGGTTNWVCAVDAHY